MQNNRNSHRRPVFLALVVAACACVWNPIAALAQDRAEPQTLREKATDLERKATDLKAQGRHDEARKLMAEVEELRNRAERMAAGENDRGMANAPDRGSHRAAARPERMPGTFDRPRQDTPVDGDEFQRRMQHLQVAIDNLHAAGMHRPAERLAQERERMLQRPDRRATPGVGRVEGRVERRDRVDSPAAEVGRLREEVMELRKAVRELQIQVEELGKRKKKKG